MPFVADPTYQNFGAWLFGHMTGATEGGQATMTHQTATFVALTLSATTFSKAAPSSGTINGAIAGSVITATGLPVGLTINSTARTWAWDGTGTISTGSFTLTETLNTVSNSPHTSTINYSITA
jgi:hypothetical protein